MPTVTLSSKFQLVVPKAVREEMKLKPGQQFRLFTLGDRLEMVPVKKPRSMRGFLKGIDTSVPRDAGRRGSGLGPALSASDVTRCVIMRS